MIKKPAIMQKKATIMNFVILICEAAFPTISFHFISIFVSSHEKKIHIKKKKMKSSKISLKKIYE